MQHIVYNVFLNIYVIFHITDSIFTLRCIALTIMPLFLSITPSNSSQIYIQQIINFFKFVASLNII